MYLLDATEYEKITNGKRLVLEYVEQREISSLSCETITEERYQVNTNVVQSFGSITHGSFIDFLFRAVINSAIL